MFVLWKYLVKQTFANALEVVIPPMQSLMQDKIFTGSAIESITASKYLSLEVMPSNNIQ